MDKEPTGQTLSGLAEEVATRGEGAYRLEPEDKLITVDSGEFLQVDLVSVRVEYDWVPEGTYSSNVYEKYDLYLKDELADEGGDITFYTIREALVNFAESTNDGVCV